MRCHAAPRCLKRPHLQPSNIRGFATSARRSQHRTVPTLLDWSTPQFRSRAFLPQQPAQLPANDDILPQAKLKWFTRSSSSSSSSDAPVVSLNHPFWTPYHDVPVPLELTSTVAGGEEHFSSAHAPLGTFLSWLRTSTTTTTSSSSSSFSPSTQAQLRIYLAQCQLADLPAPLRADAPTPELVLKAGKGDIYATNLWMGLAPTYTPLHRDPNPNLFLQLAGTKRVRLYAPEVGAALFEAVQEELAQQGSSTTSSSAVFRGEEMMAGREKALLERAVWDDSNNDRRAGHEATLSDGEALFIPLGWWHSIKGVGSGLTASVNWWFR